MYWFTGWAKMNPTWLKGEAIHNVLNLNIVCRPLGKYLLEYPDLLGTMCHVKYGWNWASFLLFIPWKTAWIRTGLVTIFLVHLGIVLTMTVGRFRPSRSPAGWRYSRRSFGTQDGYER